MGARQFIPSHPFYGVTKGKTTLLGKIDLPITFRNRTNFQTENITFDVVEFDLPLLTPIFDQIQPLWIRF